MVSLVDHTFCDAMINSCVLNYLSESQQAQLKIFKESNYFIYKITLFSTLLDFDSLWSTALKSASSAFLFYFFQYWYNWLHICEVICVFLSISRSLNSLMLFSGSLPQLWCYLRIFKLLLIVFFTPFFRFSRVPPPQFSIAFFVDPSVYAWVQLLLG